MLIQTIRAARFCGLNLNWIFDPRTAFARREPLRMSAFLKGAAEMKTGAKTTLEDLELEAIELASMIEGLDVLHQSALRPDENPETKRARNALPAMIKATTEKAWKLSRQLELAADSDGKNQS